MPEVSKTEIGRRFFKIQREKNVEVAIDKIRKTLGPDWKLYTQGDYEALKHIIGEVWVYIDREKWEAISFTKLTSGDLRELIHLGRKALDRSIDAHTAVEKGSEILLRTS
jgi:hypothetical protein